MFPDSSASNSLISDQWAQIQDNHRIPHHLITQVHCKHDHDQHDDHDHHYDQHDQNDDHDQHEQEPERPSQLELSGATWGHVGFVSDLGISIFLVYLKYKNIDLLGIS